MGSDDCWVWRRGEYEESIFVKSVKYSKTSTQLWAAIGIGFESRIPIFEWTGNSDMYIEAFKSSRFLMMVSQTFGERGWHLIQNSVNCHMSAPTLDAAFEACNAFRQWPAEFPESQPDRMSLENN